MERKNLWEKVRDKIEIAKHRRVFKENFRVKDLMGDIKIGSIVYLNLCYNRGKELLRYEGPYRVVIIREHNIVKIEGLKEPKRRTVHIVTPSSSSVKS